ncbi:hypothetical protein V8D89_000539 [Ganoderma adspersum]
MRFTFLVLAATILSIIGDVIAVEEGKGPSKVCTLRPLGEGRDDTDQVEAAIAKCGHFGTTIFGPGEYNITRKMTWDLVSSRVDLHGYLSFKPDIEYWLNASNTYRVIFLQNQASWFVVTGHDFVIDAHSAGGINGNGQPWWSYFATRVREDGDGRPIAFTLSNVTRAVVRDFRIEAQPFWCNIVADSSEVTYDGMYCNATNQDPTYAGVNIVPNTDGFDSYRSDKITLLRWDITCGDDCISFKGNSTNIFVKDAICRGGNGIAFGSVGQYVQFNDIIDNVYMENLKIIRMDLQVQPNHHQGVYFKSWPGSVDGVPPVGGGGAGGYVSNVVTKNVTLEGVIVPVHLYQTNGGHTGDTPSKLQFSNLSFVDWKGFSEGSNLVDIECSVAAPCPGMNFENFNIAVENGTAPTYTCINVVSETGLPGCKVVGSA